MGIYNDKKFGGLVKTTPSYKFPSFSNFYFTPDLNFLPFKNNQIAYFRYYKVDSIIFSNYSSYSRFDNYFRLHRISSLRTNIHIIRFYLKGIGYKFLRPKKNRSFIRVELGFSISTYIKIPNSIKVFNKKDRIAVLGFSKVDVVNFSKLLFKLRPADVYKGKGIRYTNVEYRDFKPGKQR